jgi:hypothetical protein
VRFSPDSRHIVMERGQNAADGPRRIEVCEAATGAVLATFPAGFNPRWVKPGNLVAESPNGTPGGAFDSGFAINYVPANRGQLDANGAGWWAVSDLETTRVTFGPHTGPVSHSRDPRLSESGRLASRQPATGMLQISTADLGPCEDARWSSETLLWWLGGRVWGRTTPDQGTVDLTVPGRACSHPVPLWTGSRLFVGLVLDDGELWVAEWSDLVAKNGLGWPVGKSNGSGFDWTMQADGGFLSVCYFDPLGRPVYVDLVLTQPLESMLKPAQPEPDPQPEPLPDIPWTTDPHGVVEDIWPWLAPHFTALSPDGRVGFILKSDEVSADGVTIGEWWDHDDHYIGHLEDASTGHRLYQGKRYYAHEWVALGQPVPWASLPLARNRFDDGARLWLPRRCQTGQRFRYVTNIRWNNGYVQPNIPIEIRVEVGYGRYQGREARVRGFYIPGGNAEENWYGPADGWVRHIPAGVS